jgi:hypothetical protein
MDVDGPAAEVVAPVVTETLSIQTFPAMLPISKFREVFESLAGIVKLNV